MAYAIQLFAMVAVKHIGSMFGAIALSSGCEEVNEPNFMVEELLGCIDASLPCLACKDSRFVLRNLVFIGFRSHRSGFLCLPKVM